MCLNRRGAKPGRGAAAIDFRDRIGRADCASCTLSTATPLNRGRFRAGACAGLRWPATHRDERDERHLPPSRRSWPVGAVPSTHTPRRTWLSAPPFGCVWLGPDWTGWNTTTMLFGRFACRSCPIRKAGGKETGKGPIKMSGAQPTGRSLDAHDRVKTGVANRPKL